MAEFATTRIINAPVDRVFRALVDAEDYKSSVPHIKKIEILAGSRPGVGYRFRETRELKGKESTTELEITEYEENSHARFIADQGGTVWDTIMRVKPENGHTMLSMNMEARPYKFLSRIITPFIMSVVAKAIEDDMDSIKAYCERA